MYANDEIKVLKSRIESLCSSLALAIELANRALNEAGEARRVANEASSMLGAKTTNNGTESSEGDAAYQDIDTEPVLGGSGEIVGAFQYDGDTITHCHFQFGRMVHTISDVENVGDGAWKLVIPHTNPSSATVVNTSAQTTETQTVVPLFTVQDGDITADYRGMPVIPVYEEDI